jgi:hypothetical protein
MTYNLLLKKQLKLTDLAVDKTFKDTEVIIEQIDGENNIGALTTIERKFDSDGIRRNYYFVYHKGGEVTYIEVNGFGDVEKTNEKYEGFRQKLEKAEKW